ncbi:Putative transport protein YhhT [Roseobacter fucihabitans]|uniref:Transport protein YhhT n=1 Tax=Roseobacter fucihabitans TaxID=1537242 RepID=A0ABZ2BX14_9RHOB|nr:AI-2E family transporter [Roseobacter litoralis]MBC6967203.1 AI-2 transport protein TqsA [Roseobacter litoralis]
MASETMPDTITDKTAAQAMAPTPWKRLEVPITGIFCILLLQALVWASDFLIPVTAAFLGYFVLNRPRRWLARIGISPVFSAALFTAVLTITIGVLLVQLSAPAAQFIEDLPSLMEQIKQKLSVAGGTMEAINDATVAAQEIIDDQDAETVAVEVVSDTGIAATLFSMAPGFLSRILFALILVFFLVASGDMFLTKTVQSFERFSEKRRAVEVLHAIEDRLGYYLGGIAIINAGLGVAVGIAMHLWGLPSAIVFGFMAFGLNFVPFLGGLMGATIAAAVAFVSIDGTWAAAGVFATYVILTGIEGQFITPIIIGRRMRLNTTVVFLSVAFFAWIWSVMGMVVALPILIVIKIACDETEGLRTLGRFLGDVDEKQSAVAINDEA